MKVKMNLNMYRLRGLQPLRSTMLNQLPILVACFPVPKKQDTPTVYTVRYGSLQFSSVCPFCFQKRTSIITLSVDKDCSCMNSG